MNPLFVYKEYSDSDVDAVVLKRVRDLPGSVPFFHIDIPGISPVLSFWEWMSISDINRNSWA